jgi:DNA-binding transcriptional MerR regulator
LDKAPDAFRTISEVADDLDIPQHVLRFWETRFTQIKPMKRSGGRRYYRPDDVDLLRGIRRLLYGEGYTIRGVQRILKENGIKAVQGLVDEEATPAFAPVASRASEPRMSSAAPLISRPAAKAPVVEDEPEEEAEAELEEELEEEAEDEEAEDEESDEDDSEEGDEDEEEEEVAEPVTARTAPDVVPGRAPEVRPDPAARTAPRVEPRLQQAIGRTDPASMSRANPMPAERANPAPQPRVSQQPAPQPRPSVRSLDCERLETVLEELLAARRALDAAMKDGG